MAFFEQVYKTVQKIPKGKVSTYGQIASLIGHPKLSHIVGYALHANPKPGVIPCHRVVNRHGLISSGFAFGGPKKQTALLEKEGVAVSPDGIVNLKKYLWSP